MSSSRHKRKETYVATGEVTTLEHELWDDAVESRAGITEALLASAESAEVLSGLWDNIIVEVEVDAAGLLWWGGSASITSLRGERDGLKM